MGGGGSPFSLFSFSPPQGPRVVGAPSVSGSGLDPVSARDRLSVPLFSRATNLSSSLRSLN